MVDIPDRIGVVLVGTDGVPYEASGSGVSQTDGSAFTPNTSSMVPVGGLYESTPSAVSDGDAGTLGMTANRVLKAALHNASGAVITTLPVQAAGDVANDTADSGNPVKVGGVAASSASPPTTVTAGDRVNAWYGLQGQAVIGYGSSGTGGDGVNGGFFTDAAGTARPVVVGVWNGTAYDRLRGTLADGLTVNLGANNDVTVTGTATVSGDVAHDTADSGNPVKVGFKAISPDGTAPPVVAENDRSNATGDLNGRMYVNTVHPELWNYHDDDAAAVTTDGTLHADPGDGFAVYITDIVWSIGAATASTLFIEEGATKILGPYNLPATIGAGMALHFTTPKKCTASTAILITNTGSINFAIDVMGFVAAV